VDLPNGEKAAAITGADYYLIGNALPTWYGGFSNNFKYANFDLGINLSFSGGNYIMNGTRATLLDQRAYNNSTEILNRWQNQETLLMYQDWYIMTNYQVVLLSLCQPMLKKPTSFAYKTFL